MEPTRRAVIDVGTNSVKLLVGEVTDAGVVPVREESHQTRLGQGFYKSRRLQPEPVAATAAAVAQFVAAARECGALSVRVVATSAAREAINRRDLIAAIQHAAGLTVEVLSGEQEADWVFRGAITDPRLAGETFLLLDVGGGSTELVAGKDRTRFFERSVPLGTVRLLEQLAPPEPPRSEDLERCREWLRTFLVEQVQPELAPALGRAAAGSAPRQPVLIATGGTASILACMECGLTVFDRAKIEAARLSRNSVRALTEKLWSLPLEQRRLLTGLPPNRADVILMGAAIYEGVLNIFDFSELRVSTRGLRFAALIMT